MFIRRPKGSNTPKEITVGRCGAMSVGQARHQARRLAVEFSAPDYLSSKASRDAAPNFQDAVHQYDELALSKRSAAYRQKTLGTLRRYAIGKLDALKVSDVERQHVAAIVTPLMRDGKDATAQMVFEGLEQQNVW